jgi:hypothetical protein
MARQRSLFVLIFILTGRGVAFEKMTISLPRMDTLFLNGKRSRDYGELLKKLPWRL